MISRDVRRNMEMLPVRNAQETSSHLHKQAIKGITNRTMGERTQRNHEVIDINLNINVNVNDKPQTKVIPSRNINMSHQPTLPSYFTPKYQPGPNVFNKSNGRMPHALPNHRTPVARPSASFVRLPEAFKRIQTAVVMPSSYPSPTSVTNQSQVSYVQVTQVAVNPPKQPEAPFVAAQKREVLNQIVEQQVIPSLIVPTTTVIPPLPALIKNPSVDCYIPSTIINQDEILTCVLCKEKYLVRDKQRHSNIHRKSLITTRASGTMNQTVINSLEKDIRQSNMRDVYLQRMTIELDPRQRTKYEFDPRQRIRDLFQAESVKVSYNRTNLSELPSEENGTASIRYVNSVALRGSQDIRMTADRFQSYRINQSLNAPSFLGPHAGGGGSNVPSTIPGVTPEFFIDCNNPAKDNAFQRGILATIPSVMSERNSVAYTNDANADSLRKLRQQTNSINLSTQLAGAPSGQQVNSLAGWY